jgi:hypothetical protein
MSALISAGGGNGAQRCAWKQELQRQLCDGLALRITVSLRLLSRVPKNG